MSLIERAVKRMDEVPAAPFRADPRTRAPVDDDGDRRTSRTPTARVPRAQPVHASAARAATRASDAGAARRRPRRRRRLGRAAGRRRSATNSTAAGRACAARRVTIDLQRLREGGMIAPDGDKTPLAEEFRVIKRPLLKNAFGGGVVDPQRQPDHGHERVPARGQELLRDQPRDVDRDGARPHGAAGRRRRRPPVDPAEVRHRARRRPDGRAARLARQPVRRDRPHQRQQARAAAGRPPAPPGDRTARQRGDGEPAGRVVANATPTAS